MTESNKLEIHRVMHEIKRRRLEVLRVVDITPRMRRITLGGPQLAGFVSLGSDDHIKLLFPQNAAEQAALDSPTFTLQGDGPKPAMRDYTPRRFDLSINDAGHRLRAARRWPCVHVGRAGESRPAPAHRRPAGFDDRAGYLRQLPVDRR